MSEKLELEYELYRFVAENSLKSDPEMPVAGQSGEILGAKMNSVDKLYENLLYKLFEIVCSNPTKPISHRSYPISKLSLQISNSLSRSQRCLQK